MPCAVCAVSNAKAYSIGCEVSSCNIGWRVSDDNAKCVANTCSCANGIASTGAKCVSDRNKICESCGAGFKLENLRSACTGPFRVDRDDRWYQIMLAKRFSKICVRRRWVCRSAPQPGVYYTYGVGYGQRMQQRAVSTRS